MTRTDFRLQITRLLFPVMAFMGWLFASCTDETGGTAGSGADGGANLYITVPAPQAQKLSRVASDRTDRSRIETMNIVLADGAGNIVNVFYADQNTQAVAGGQDVTGPLSPQGGGNPLPQEGGTMAYHIAPGDVQGCQQIAVVCNYRQGDQYVDLSQTLQGKTLDALRSLQQGVSMQGVTTLTTTLYGEGTPAGTDSHGGRCYNVSLERVTAMVTVAVAAHDLLDGVRITPRSIKLCNVPQTVCIGKDSRSGQDGIQPSADGQSVQVNWGSLTSASSTQTVLGGHGADENIVPLFLFENLQGTNQPAGSASGQYADEINKTPASGNESNCSYLEITADYLYTPTGAGTNQKYISGPIKYRLYLGADVTQDFNVERNKHYQVTLTLTKMGGLVEDGRTDDQGNLISNPEDLSWRVESSDISDVAFLSDGVNAPSNGYLTYLGFVGDPDKQYAVYCLDGSGNAVWVSSYINQGYGSYRWYTPSSAAPSVVYGADEVSGEEGVSYVKIYVTPWIDDGWMWESQAHGSIKTLDEWIENGYRETTLALAEITGGSAGNYRVGEPLQEITIRQWLPMPVMIDDDGSTITDPNKASLYYSRIDVYEGEEIPWAPPSYDDWNANGLRTDNLGIYDGNPWASGRQRDYTATYGFDNCIALYVTDRNGMKAFTFDNANGHPGSAMGMAIYRAGNAWNAGVMMPNEGPVFDELARIGLPTVEEWEKIREYGAIDPRFGIPNVPYWTSSMEGTQTYVYNPVSGEKRLETRSVGHRTRLIYHKNDFATPNVR